MPDCWQSPALFVAFPARLATACASLKIMHEHKFDYTLTPLKGVFFCYEPQMKGIGM